MGNTFSQKNRQGMNQMIVCRVNVFTIKLKWWFMHLKVEINEVSLLSGSGYC